VNSLNMLRATNHSPSLTQYWNRSFCRGDQRSSVQEVSTPEVVSSTELVQLIIRAVGKTGAGLRHSARPRL